MRVLCIAGFSAVGKKETIRRLLAGDVGLRRRLGVVDPVYATGYAFQFFSRESCRAAATVLVQWQIAEHGKLATLREWFPGAEHRIYFLLRDWDAHLASHRAKYPGGDASIAELQARTPSPLNELYDVWFEARLKKNRCVRIGLKLPGPIRLEVRKRLFERVMDIQRRAGVMLIMPEDEVFIRECWAEKRYPRGWSEADELVQPPEDMSLFMQL